MNLMMKCNECLGLGWEKCDSLQLHFYNNGSFKFYVHNVKKNNEVFTESETMAQTWLIKSTK